MGRRLVALVKHIRILSSVGHVTRKDKKDTRWISAFVEARPSEDYPPHWFFEDVQFLVSLINFQDWERCKRTDLAF